MWYEILYFVHQVAWLIYSTLSMLYQSLLLVGAIGIAAQALFGFVHIGGGGAAHAAGAAAHHAGGGAAAAAGHGPAAAGPHHTHMAEGYGKAPAAASSSSKVSSAIWNLFSPLTIFSFCLGVGATGLLLRSVLAGPWEAFAALLGGALFCRLVVRPLWGLVFRFASKPAETLTGAVAAEAIAVSRFDAQGRGVVRVTVDGQLVRLLAYLDRQDREKGVTVVPGDKLVVTGVDGKCNTCTVARL